MEQRKREREIARGYLVGCVAVVLLWTVASAQLRYSISEEVEDGTMVGNIARDLGLDKNTLKDRKYRIVSSTADPLFYVNPNDGVLYVSRKIDREDVCAQSSACVINVKTVLENPLEVHYVEVEVADINDHEPIFHEKDKKLEISESVLPGARIQLKAALDRDIGQFSVQQYKLSNNDHFRLEVKDKGDDGKIPILVVQKSLDREIAGSHSLILKALDGGKPPKSGDMNILVNVLDINDNAPAFPKHDYSFTLSENIPLGTIVVQVNATDLDDGPNGEIVYSFKNPLEVHYVGVDVLDINDHAPVFPEENKILEISESVLPGARFQLKPSRDLDSGQFSVQQYKLNHNDHFRLEVRDKGDDGKIPILVLQKALDREAAHSHSLVLTALDGGKPPKSGDMNILVNVLDVNDNTPIFSKDLYSVKLNENAPVGTEVIQVNATDPDHSQNGEVVYSFGNSVSNNVFNLFDIDQSTGKITVKGLLDYEQKDKYEIEIQASDRGLAPLTTEKSVIIKIVDVNDNAPEIEVTSFSSSIPEDSRPGTTVAIISVNDLDSGVNGKVICSLGDDVPFALSPSLQDKMYSLVTKSPLDREKQSQYELTITAKDAGQPPLSSEKTISVTVSDVNDNSPEFSLSPYTFYVTEGNSPGASVFAVKASDRDENDNARISYHIIRDGSEDNKVTSFLNINSENGEILALKSFDFETMKTFQFQVVASDSGTPSLSNNVTVNVFILDQNDNAPVILYPLSSNGSTKGVEEIPRNVNAGHLVTKVRAYDADIGYNGWLLFSLQEVTDHSLFALDRYTGQIRTLRSFTETDEAEHKLLILVKDNGNVSLSATATVIVKLVEPKEAFAASDVKSAAKDDEDSNVIFYLMITLGAVSVLFLVSIIVLIAMQCSKSTDYTSKYLPETNYDGTLCHSIQYRSGEKRYMLVGPRMSIGSTIVPGSHANTLVLPDRRRTSEEVRKTLFKQLQRLHPGSERQCSSHPVSTQLQRFGSSQSL
uniref:Protocadherin alpha-8-like n=1 Tax=Haplochromis burtoni TaxID=8153 RepID=A0A3Q2VIW8_HAPBU